MSDLISVRDARATDETEWRRLWSGYNDFYAATVPETVADATWTRIMDPSRQIFCRVADRDGSVVGFCNFVLHEGTWVESPVCYLEDLFVDPAHRKRGIGRLLMDDLIDMGRSKNWSRVYWHTRRDNPARRLYDRYVSADDFVRYRLELSERED